MNGNKRQAIIEHKSIQQRGKHMKKTKPSVMSSVFLPFGVHGPMRSPYAKDRVACEHVKQQERIVSANSSQ